MFCPLAVIPLSVDHFQFYENVFMNYQIYSETFVEIGGWGGIGTFFKF